MTDLKKIGEFGLIDRFRSRLQYRSPRIKIGIGDDCAVYEGKAGNYQIITADALIENVHFKLSTTSPKLLGRKAMSVNVSDIAAMGGTPHLALVSLGIPKSLPVKFLDDFYKGIDQVCMEHKIELAGGDTTASPRHLFINITMVGDVNKKHMIPRSGARPGDKIFVTGAPGQSALGLKLLTSRRKKWQGNSKFKNKMIQAHLDPVPRLPEAVKLVNSKIKISAMIDVSDGLVQDLFHILADSGVGAVLREERLPQSAEMAALCSLNRLNLMDLILSGGEDYELLFTLKSEDVRKLEKLFHNAKTPVTQIGEVSAQSENVVLAKSDGTIKPLQEFMGFNHFRSKEPLFPR
jgi:thiamine-monophosphate kinase